MGIIIIKPNYRGVELTDFQTRTFYKKNAVDRFTVLPGVKDKFGMNFLDFTGTVLGAPGCTFTSNVDALLTEKNLVIDTYDIGMEECIDKWETSYLADELRAGSNNVEFPPSFETWLMEKLPMKIADELERKAFSELSTELTADVNKISVTILPITTLNAIDELAKVYQAIPGELFGNEDLAIMMNYNVWKNFQVNAFDTSVPELITDGIKMTFLGVELVPAPTFNAGLGGGLADDVLIAGKLSNFVRATDMLSDDNELNILNMRETTGDKVIRVTGSLKFKTSYAISEEIVYATV